MLDSLSRLAALPGDTRLCCGHEYTVANAAFARVVEPDNPALQRRTEQAQALRGDGRPTCPARSRANWQPIRSCVSTPAEVCTSLRDASGRSPGGQCRSVRRVAALERRVRRVTASTGAGGSRPGLRLALAAAQDGRRPGGRRRTEIPATPASPTRNGRQIYEDFRTGLADPECEAGATSRWRQHFATAPKRLAADDDLLPLFGYVVDALRQAHLPTEFALIPFVESGYQPGARSPAGPAGFGR